MTALLETRGVWQRFGGLVANRDVSISVGRGEIVGLIGPTAPASRRCSISSPASCRRRKDQSGSMARM